jgi:hypothetical protein
MFGHNQCSASLLGAQKTGSEFESIGTDTVTRDEIRQFAEGWVAAWNAHDLETIISHYDEGVELISPVAEQLLGIPNGKVRGKASVREYFQRGLETYPELHFDLKDVLAGLNSVMLYYTNQKGTRTAEFMEFGAGRKVTRVVAHYSI